MVCRQNNAILEKHEQKMDNESIRARIKALREEARVTQSEAAEMLGVCRSTVINYEKSVQLVNPMLSEIAKALGTTEEYLIFGKDPDENQHFLMDSSAEERFNRQRKLLVDDYERRLAQLRRQVQELERLCSEQRDHINTLKRINQRLELNDNND